MREIDLKYLGKIASSLGTGGKNMASDILEAAVSVALLADR